MILDQMDNHMGDNISHMMDWGPYIWLYMILGFIIFLIIVIILLYILNRGQSIVDKQLSLKIQHNNNLESKDRIEHYTQKNEFCTYCGIVLKDEDIKYCPNCGNEIKT